MRVRWLASTVVVLACAAGARAQPPAAELSALPRMEPPQLEVPTPEDSPIPSPSPVQIEPESVGPPAPWLSDAELRERIARVQDIVAVAANTHMVEPELINGIIYVESKFEPKAKGGKAQGLMQLMPGTAAAMAKDLGRPRNTYDPDFNIHAGSRLLRRLLDRFDGDVELAVAAYNRGSGVVAEWVRTGEPMPERTRGYVDRVLRARAWFLASPP